MMKTRATCRIAFAWLIIALGSPVAAQTECDSIGPDLIMGDLNGVANYSGADGIDAFAVGFVQCNIGDAPVLTNGMNNQHQVVAQNLYRLMTVDDAVRFEQIGMAWAFHTFSSLGQNVCCNGCQPSQDFLSLGPHCSSPDAAAFGGHQPSLGPRYQINASTGAFPYPFVAANYNGSLARRLQAHVSDIDAALNPGAQYFVETVSIAADDQGAGNAPNNASHRRVQFAGSGAAWSMSYVPGHATQRELAALHAWAAADPAMLLTAVDVPGDGRFILGSKAMLLASGQWRYEYALMNFNSDRSARAFSVPLTSATEISSVGFHDVDYHSGDGLNNVNFDDTDWPATVAGDEISWSTQSFDEHPSANALRWATLYNFRFDADAAPASRPGEVSIALFKPGAPSAVGIAAIVPQLLQPCPADTNNSGGVDVSDLLAVINAWGPCPAPCSADINADGEVNVSDLLAVINAWGDCP